jgi:hypothetical protein
MKTPRIPEKVIQQQIVRLLRSLGAAVYVMGTARPRGDYAGTCQTPGIPDLVVFLPSRGTGTNEQRLVYVEVKAAGGTLRPAQADFRAHCLAADVAHVVGDLDAVIAWLMDYGYLKAEAVPYYRLPGGKGLTRAEDV